MQIGIDSFAAAFTEDSLSISASDRLQNLIEEIALADKAGLDSFGIGEHHRREFLDYAPPVILAAAAARTRKIRLTSAVTVLSATDPVRIFQEFATLDLLSKGRAEMVVGRGSSIEAFPLFGFRLEDYDSLFVEKLDLLLKIRENEHVTWSGKYRPPLTGQGVYPRPVQNPLPIWLGVGGTPDRKSTRLNSSHITISYAVFCLKKNTMRTPHASGHIFLKTSIMPEAARAIRSSLT